MALQTSCVTGAVPQILCWGVPLPWATTVDGSSVPASGGSCSGGRLFGRQRPRHEGFGRVQQGRNGSLAGACSGACDATRRRAALKGVVGGGGVVEAVACGK